MQEDRIGSRNTNGNDNNVDVIRILNNKEKRKAKKERKLLAEYEMSLSNDQVKRPGELLAAPEAKKLRVDPGENKKLSPEEFKELKKLLNERKKILTQLPRFFLQGAGVASSMSTSHDVREPIFMSDVQQLLLYALGGNHLIQPPARWCSMQKANRLTHVLTLVVEGITSKDFSCYEHLFPKLTANFEHRVELMAPAYYGRDVAQELSCVPLSNVQKDAILKKYGSMERAVSHKEIVKQFRALFPTKVDENAENVPSMSLSLKRLDHPDGDIFPRTYLLLGLNQMTFEGYPMPFWQDYSDRYKEYKLSKQVYKEVNGYSPMFGIDCEMCITEDNPSELTRIAVINEALEVVYESYVKPKSKITNYLTKFSGITEEILKDVTTTIEDVQEALARLLPEDAIWIGQSLNCDLHALKLMHPYVIDTSVIFNLSGITGRKSKLSHLAFTFLNEEIQNGKNGHCPIEDAKAAMKLVKLKLAQGFLFGDHSAATDELVVPGKVLATSIFNRTYKQNKTVAVIGPQRVLEEYKKVTMTPPEGTAFSPMEISSNKEAVNKLAEIATSHQLTIAHIDLSDKLESKDKEKLHKKKEKLFGTVDDWCDTVFKNVSLNGMCVIVFSGPKKVSESKHIDPTASLDSKNSSTSTSPQNSNNSKDKDSNNPSPSSEVPDSSALPKPDQQTETKRSRPRRNGVCFIRVNTKKV